MFVRVVLLVLLMLAPSATNAVRAATAYQPPAIRGHVTDMAGKLAPVEIAALNEKLADYRKCSTHHIAVFIAASLEGNTIEDVAYITFNTWKIGVAGKDNGVLLLIAPAERKNFIATGKGVGGELPDLDAYHILRDKVSPRLKEEKMFVAIDDGTTAIGAALGGCAMKPAAPSQVSASSPPRAPTEGRAAAQADARDRSHTTARFGMVGGVVVLVLMALWGLRAQPPSFLVVGLMTTMFGIVISGFYSSFSGFDVNGAASAFGYIGALLVFVNVVVWLVRLRAPRRTGPFAPDSPENRAASAGGYSGATSLSGSSSFGSSSSSSSSSSASLSSSSSDSSYSGGGGTTGGGGAGDSY